MAETVRRGATLKPGSCLLEMPYLKEFKLISREFRLRRSRFNMESTDEGSLPTHHRFGSGTADAIVAGLKEENSRLREGSLRRLYSIVDRCWSEISDAIPLIEELSEDDTFRSHELAAAVASKIFFHLEEYDDALRLALGAGNFFDIDARTEYVEMLISKCMDTYIQNHQSSPIGIQSHDLDPRLANVIERMFQRCYADGKYFHAVGVALEAHRLNKVEEIVTRCPLGDRHALFSYVLEVIPSVTATCAFRQLVVRTLVTLHPLLPSPDYIFLCSALQYLGASNEVQDLLLKLVDGKNHHETLLGYQLAFLIAESDNHRFIFDIVSKLRDPAGSSTLNDLHQNHISHLIRIMDTDGLASKISLDFMSTRSRTDTLIFKAIKESIDGNRNSVLHNATVISHSYANASTKDTAFLRNNLDWMGKASNWAKFIATSSIGVIHQGHVEESIRILQPYLPQTPASNSPFSEGGALYALGLIHANKAQLSTSAAVSRLIDALHSSGNSEPLQHGACLGLGLAAMSTGKAQYYDELRTVLYFDSAIAGEAAAYGIGLLLLGHGDETLLSQNAISELYSYAHETCHEKIIRAVALAISLIVCGKEKAAETTIEMLLRDRDAIIRYGGMHAIGLAYAGTANNQAVKRLLHVAVSDVSDDVRRAAVTCLGFVLFRNPKRILALVGLLLESFNPHVRYGACMAIGLSHPASGDVDAIALLQPLQTDAIDFVRQGALMATALVVMQQSSAQVHMLGSFRNKITELVKDKYPSTLTKVGAIIAAGIMDAGGRNCAVALQSSSGFLKHSACAGMALWVQSWYWYPMFHFFSLALTPTVLIGLNSNFDMPTDFSVICSGSPDLFAYPPLTTEKQETKKERVATAILSTTLKHKVREKAKDKHKASSSASDPDATSISLSNADLTSPQEPLDACAQVTVGSSFRLSNPSRLTQIQMKSCKFDLEQRFVPVATTIKTHGIIMLADREPSTMPQITRFHDFARAVNESALPTAFEWPYGLL